MRNEEGGGLFFVLGVGEMRVDGLRMRFELACCYDIFECVGDACGVRQQFLYTESVLTKGVD